MPKEQPLQQLILLLRRIKPKLVILIILLLQIQQLCRGFHYRERWRSRIVHENRDAAIGVETQEPILLLLVGANVDDGVGVRDVVESFEFFEEDLDFLAVRCGLCNQVEAL